MIEIVWVFEVRPDSIAAFERHYGAQGTWAQFFAQTSGFNSTRLLRDTAELTRYITIDTWKSREGFEDFKYANADEYARIDAQMEGLTNRETLVGIFEHV